MIRFQMLLANELQIVQAFVVIRRLWIVPNLGKRFYLHN